MRLRPADRFLTQLNEWELSKHRREQATEEQELEPVKLGALTELPFSLIIQVRYIFGLIVNTSNQMMHSYTTVSKPETQST